MVKRMPVRQVDPQLALQHPVAELNELGFRCIIAFVAEGTQVTFEDTKFTTSRDHWLDMDIDDFSDVFQLHPDDIELWFEDVWPKLTEKLELVENSMPQMRGGIIPASSTANLLAAFAALDETVINTSKSMKLFNHSILPRDFGLKVMRPNPVSITVKNIS